MDNSLRNLLIIVLVFLVFLVVLAFVAAYFAVRQLRRFTSPDVLDMQRKLAQMRAANPGVSDETLIQRIIHQQSLKCGLVGAITGIGGFLTLPVALPIDILVSLRIQATMVRFIATMYGQTQPNSEEMRLETYLVMSGGVELTEATFKVIMRFVTRIIGESLSEFIPVFGAVAGFAVNYFMARATGNVALRWYSGKQPRRISA
jgi:uncharacterized protein (DUF697 family)